MYITFIESMQFDFSTSCIVDTSADNQSWSHVCLPWWELIGSLSIDNSDAKDDTS